MANENKGANARRRAARGQQRPRTGHPNARPDRPAGDQVAQAKRSYERYVALARDAASAGDPIESENFYQHAEHYLRTMREQLEGRRRSDDESPTVAAS